jgi:predicted dehydrogenase
MSSNKQSEKATSTGRRNFLLSSAKIGAGVLAGVGMAKAAKAQTAPKPDDLNVALIGVGAEGRVLMEAMLNIPGIRFKAVCDIWDYSQRYGYRFLMKYGHDVKVYEDYQEMLDTETDLDAVVIATPDWMHAEHANACMRAGLHVYCEKEMSNSLEKAKTMVDTQHETGMLLQIGHQRRSNPRYIHAVDKLIHEANLLGRVTQANGQWNRAKSEDLGWPKKNTMDQAKLEKYGYATMSQFRNWRWYKKYGGGPIVDLGSHQIDIYSWVFGANPKAVMAAGGVDFYKQHEWYDNVMAIFDYENEFGTSRAFYQVLTTTGHGGFHETFMGVNGSLQISEVPQRGNTASREAHAPEWDTWAKKGYIQPLIAPLKASTTKNVVVDTRVTAPAGKWPLPIDLAKPVHQPHLENFFDAIRIGTPLNCPVEIGYETAVAVLNVNKAVETGLKIQFNEKDFHA